MHSGRRSEGVGLLVGWTLLYGWMVWAYLKVGNLHTLQQCLRRALLRFLLRSSPAHSASLAQDHDESHANNYPTLVNIEDDNTFTALANEWGHHHTQASTMPGILAPQRTIAAPVSLVRALRNREAVSGAPLSRLWDLHPQIRSPLPLYFPFSLVSTPLILPNISHLTCPPPTGIGQCVGARNHKFFLNFSFATLAFTSYTFASLIAFNIPAQTDGGRSVDPQEVVIIALAALFALFTASFGAADTRLILLLQTTIRREPRCAAYEEKGTRGPGEGGGEVLGGRIRGV
ncbi:hypothetical protein C8R44DRAFT_980970 [Mycena epipterygia]|nr:hypothetical protein C8R44DRAFT_980970 [Mycena epipterygia]